MLGKTMNRRQFIKISILGGIALSVGGGGFMALGGRKNKEGLTLELSLQKLDQLANLTLTSTGSWNPAQIFIHCAQSIEYSMSRFPEHKPELFKSTLGKLAFSIFSFRGKMSHGLSEPIPSAPSLDPKETIAQALARLKQAFTNFQQFEGPLAPHFAYGALSKQ